jgi:Uma2 family endonuclease
MSTTSLRSVLRPEFPVRRFTVEEYHRLGEVGILTEDDRVELLEGFVVPKMIHNPPHDATVKLTDEAIRNRLPAEWHTRVQSAITTDDSEPEPDVAVVRGSIRDFAARHPGPSDIGMLAEVAESSLERDRSKRRLYSRAGIPYYWIVNVADRQVEVYGEATVQGQEPDYREKQIYRVGQTVPLLLGGRHLGNIPVSDLLP